MKPIKDNEIKDQDYLFPYTKMRIYMVVLAIFLFGLILHFPLKKILKTKLESNISKLAPCPLAYEELDIGFFLPKVIFNKLTISHLCTDVADLKTKEFILGFRGLGLSPFGLKASVSLETNKSHIDLTIVQGIGERTYRLNDTKMGLVDLKKLVELPGLTGDLMIQTEASFDKQGNLDNLEGTITSKNLEVPVQKVMGLDLPLLTLHPFSVKYDLTNKNVINIREFKLGSETGVVSASFKGTIRYIKERPMSSELNLQGQVRFSDSFLEQFPILPKIILKRFDKIDGRYQMKLRGNLESPSPTPL